MKLSSLLRALMAVACLATGPRAWGAGTAAPGAPPVPADAVTEARSVEEALNGLRGLIASFTQTVESAGLPRPQTERGTIYLLRPGRMRFEYDVPRGKLAIADGRKSYVYLPEERQVLVAPLDSEGSRTGVSILLQRVDLIGSFEISWGPGNDRGQRPLLLKPRAPRPEYDFLLLTPGADHLVRGLTIVDPLGSRITYRFDRLRRVDTLDEDLFRFEPPAGIEVQEMPGP
jgi:outer membrane lipoprotein carrier protein